MRSLRSSALAALLIAAVGTARAEGPAPTPAAPPGPALGPVAERCREHPEDPGCKAGQPTPPLVVPPGMEAQPNQSGQKSESGGKPGNLDVGSCALPKGGSCSGGGSGGGEAILLLAVIAAAALPVVVYLADDEASPEVQSRFDNFSTRFALYGGATSTTSVEAVWAPLVGARFTGGYKFIGLDALVESGGDPESYSAAHLHLLLRPPPREHIEGGLALGLGELAFDGLLHPGFEVGLPHRYLLWGPEGSGGGLELDPSVLFEEHGPDLRLELAAVVPIGRYVELRVFARAYSVEHQVHLAAGAGASGGF